jgi:hypothetical protein
MRSTKFLGKVRLELEAPREERPFGSGWLSGSLALLAGIVGALMVVVLRYPSIASIPQLAVIDQSVAFRLALYFVLVSGFVLAALSLVLRRDKTLGGAAMLVTVFATMFGSLPSHHDIKIGLLHPQCSVHRHAVHPGRAPVRPEQEPARVSR